MPGGIVFSVIVVNYNSGDRLRRCLDCLAEQTFRAFEVIVIDNSSTDGSPAIARDHRLAPKVIDAGSNLGFAAANNRAAHIAAGEWLAFLNPDAYARPDWLQRLVEATARHPYADAFGSMQLNAADPSRLDGAGDCFHLFGVAYRGAYGHPAASAPAEGECFAPCAAAALYRASAFRALGGFDERFFCYNEDVDLGYRLRLAGGRAVQVPTAVVLHEGSGVTGRHSDFTIYHGHRNRLWTHYKNTPLPLLVVGLPGHLLLNVYLLLRFCFAGGASAYARAMRDAVSGVSAFREDRRRLLAGRRASLRDIARVMTWSPLALILRRAKILPADAAAGPRP